MADEVADELLMLCPACGYDLRATGGDRCSECGLTIDRAALAESGYPWAHRRTIGRVRSYWRTVWAVLRGDRRLANETARVQEPRDGRRFRWVTAGVVAVTFLAAWGWALAESRQGLGLTYRPAFGMWSGRPVPAGRMADLAVPWSAGVTIGWVVPACLVALAIYITGVQQAVFRVSGKPEVYRKRVGAIAHYSAGPLAMLLPALVYLGVAVVSWNGVRLQASTAALGALGLLTAAAAVVGTWWRVGQWVARARHGGAGAGWLASLELLGLWVLGVILIIGGIPLAVGFFWIVIDGFR